MYTLKLKGSNQPLFIDDEGLLTNKPTDKPILFDEVNDVAKAYFNKEIKFSAFIDEYKVVVTRFDIVQLAQNKKIILTEEQIQDHEFKLLDHDNFVHEISRERGAKLYLKNEKLTLTDPRLKRLVILAVDNKHQDIFNAGDTIVACSDKGRKIFSYGAYEMFDSVDMEKLYQNHDIDINKKSYIAALKIFN